MVSSNMLWTGIITVGVEHVCTRVNRNSFQSVFKFCLLWSQSGIFLHIFKDVESVDIFKHPNCKEGDAGLALCVARVKELHVTIRTIK